MKILSALLLVLAFTFSSCVTSDGEYKTTSDLISDFFTAPNCEEMIYEKLAELKDQCMFVMPLGKKTDCCEHSGILLACNPGGEYYGIYFVDTQDTAEIDKFDEAKEPGFTEMKYLDTCEWYDEDKGKDFEYKVYIMDRRSAPIKKD